MNRDFNAEDIEDTEELPWLIFMLDNRAYALNSRYVSGIEMKDEHMTPMPEAPDVYCGLVERRGNVYPVADMRRLFGYPTIDEEVCNFKTMMEQRKQDHVKWVETLERCVKTGEKFALATDPHKCAFGKWYYEFIENNHSAGIHIKKVEGPHSLLHKTAQPVLDAVKAGNMEKADKLLQKAKTDYIPKVLSVLDEAEHVYRNTFHETVIIISDGSHMMGLLVDEVIAVGKIKPVSGNETIGIITKSSYFEGVARSDKTKLEILIIDEDELIKLADIGN